VMHDKQISDNEIYLLIVYIKSLLWRVAKRLSYIEEARCPKLKKQREKVLFPSYAPLSPKEHYYV